MLLINPRIVILQGTGSQVTPGFPHSQIHLQVASPKVREHGRTTPMTYELATDTYYGLGVVTHAIGTYNGIPCHNIMTMMCKLVVPLNPSHSPIGVDFVSNCTLTTPSGIARHAKTASIVKCYVTVGTFA